MRTARSECFDRLLTLNHQHLERSNRRDLPRKLRRHVVSSSTAISFIAVDSRGSRESPIAPLRLAFGPCKTYAGVRIVVFTPGVQDRVRSTTHEKTWLFKHSSRSVREGFNERGSRPASRAE